MTRLCMSTGQTHKGTHALTTQDGTQKNYLQSLDGRHGHKPCGNKKHEAALLKRTDCKDHTDTPDSECTLSKPPFTSIIPQPLPCSLSQADAWHTVTASPHTTITLPYLHWLHAHPKHPPIQCSASSNPHRAALSCGKELQK